MAIRRSQLFIESLERRECLTATVMEVEPNDDQFQGTPFAMDPADNSAELIGTSVNDDDKDWFRFTVPADGTLTADVASGNGNFAALEVERANGMEVMSTDPNDGINTASAGVSAGEELFVRLRSKTDSAADYNALLTLDAGGDPPVDPPGVDPPGEPTQFFQEMENNDRKSRANPFALIPDGVIQLQGTSNSDRDRDFFVFTMPTDGDVIFEVNSPNNEFAQLQIEDRFGNDIVETDPNDGINVGSVTLRGGDTFFLRMRAKDSAPAQYEVNLGLTAPTGAVIGEATPNFYKTATPGSGNSISLIQPSDGEVGEVTTPVPRTAWNAHQEDIVSQRDVVSQRDREDATDHLFMDLELGLNAF